MVASINLKTPTAVAEFLLARFQENDIRLGSLSGRISGKVSQLLGQKNQIISSLLKDLPLKVENKLERNNKYLISTGTILARSASGFIQGNRYLLHSTHSGYQFSIKNYLLKLNNLQKDIVTRALPDRIKKLLGKKSDVLMLFKTTVELVDPANILKKGYALVLKNGRIVKSVKNINNQDILETKFHDGRIESKVLNSELTKLDE
jgi:exodeoxyribonuclease VII large subunit